MGKPISMMDNLECPNCNTDLDIEAIEQFCMEPYNGVMHICHDCKHELSLSMYMKIEDFGESDSE